MSFRKLFPRKKGAKASSSPGLNWRALSVSGGIVIDKDFQDSKVALLSNHDKLERLRNLPLFVLDNSVRETMVAQIRGHTVQEKYKLLDIRDFPPARMLLTMEADLIANRKEESLCGWVRLVVRAIRLGDGPCRQSCCKCRQRNGRASTDHGTSQLLLGEEIVPFRGRSNDYVHSVL
jgi:hypothetical protein